MTYPVGKLPQADLLELLSQLPANDDPSVIFGPGLGRDAAVIAFGERYLVAKSDPITFATSEIGWYAVNVNANDIACLGATPRWFIATLLLPEGKSDKPLVTHIFSQLKEATREIGVSLIGGHTEINYGLDRPILAGTMLGEVAPDKMIRSDGARPGDALILTKGISVEGTALLAREAASRLSDLPADVLAGAKAFLHRPGISVVREAAILAASGAAHAMHDPTEGGVATGIYEIAEAAGLGVLINAHALPIYPETRLLCDALQLDPLGVLASGALLAAVAPQAVETVLATLHRNGITAAHIGTFRATSGVTLRTPDGDRPLPRFPRDEVARLFEA